MGALGTSFTSASERGRSSERSTRNTAGMENRWTDSEAADWPGLLGERIYTSRLLGRDAALVMHGGGNTSVKVVETDLFGDPVDTLYVKGSGSDLVSMTAAGFAPVRLDRLIALAQLDDLSDSEMAQQLKLVCTREAPAPSVEAILHAILPARYVDHTHADAVLTMTNTTNGRKHVEDCFGDAVVFVDYVMPGFALAKQCAKDYPAQATERTIGMVLMNHGVFSFGDTARQSYERMIALVQRAEDYLDAHGAGRLSTLSLPVDVAPRCAEIAELRKQLSMVAGAPLIVSTTATPRTAAFLARDDLSDVAARGPMTPDHVIRTKRVPMVGTDVAAYASDYEQYFARNAARSPNELTMLDAAPRVVFDRGFGLLTAGRSVGDAAIARDIALHTIDAIERAELLDRWVALSEGDLFPTIRATDPATGIEGSAVVTVSSAQLVSIAISPGHPSVPLGNQQQFTAVGTYTDGTDAGPHGERGLVIVSSRRGLRHDGGSSGGARLHDRHGHDHHLGQGPRDGHLDQHALDGDRRPPQLPRDHATGPLHRPRCEAAAHGDGHLHRLDHSRPHGTVLWGSSDAAIAQVSNTAGANGLASGAGVGSATIRATDEASGLSATTTLTVTAARLVSIAVTPATSSLPVASRSSSRRRARTPIVRRTT